MMRTGATSSGSRAGFPAEITPSLRRQSRDSPHDNHSLDATKWGIMPFILIGDSLGSHGPNWCAAFAISVPQRLTKQNWSIYFSAGLSLSNIFYSTDKAYREYMLLKHYLSEVQECRKQSFPKTSSGASQQPGMHLARPERVGISHTTAAPATRLKAQQNKMAVGQQFGALSARHQARLQTAAPATLHATRTTGLRKISNCWRRRALKPTGSPCHGPE